MMKANDTEWDLVVIGGGTAGIVASRTAAGLGARVALVERAAPGGDCLWTGCVPSKALIAAAHHVAVARRAPGFGVSSPVGAVDFPAVMAQVKAAIEAIAPDDSVEAMVAAGVEVITGSARFIAAGALEVDGRRVELRRAIITTGARPAIPPVPGLREAEPLTSDTVWDLQALPDRLVVMGGGSIGCELGQSFARLGSRVTLVEALPRILAREDPDAARLVQDMFDRDGVHVRAGQPVVAVRGGAGHPGELVLDGPSSSSTVEFDRLLVAVGRRPNTAGLQVDVAGVQLDERGFVQIDDHLRTSNPRIWAAGDVTALPPFTHTAGVFGSLAATNAILGLRRTVDLSAVPRVTFTDPEVAAVGLPTWAENGERAPRTLTQEHAHVDRAVVDGRTDGFSRLTVGRGSRIVGATVVGPRAGETLAELTLAVRKNLTTSDLAGTIHPYPTYGDGPWNATIADVRSKVAAPIVQRIAAVLRWLRGLRSK
ncbi:FAD-dependent oxidoreductase [Nakamurella sp. A5-74]|uniref:FAD-dependent oxidoreductase n=1 Tax=Nakamurella sp. A5-74 TaxID=3158264 RepID=A0AAU8DPZ0_9ACTN